jgi:putative peptide zinc metalloprotease protein
LAPEEYALTRLMDGSRTLARLVAEFARISGRLAPEQVRRIVADLAGNRMLEELPVDAFAPLQRVRRRPWPLRLGRGLLAFAQGRRMVLANVDPVVGFLYKAGGRLLFTRAAAALMGTVAVLGLGAFGWQWFTGEQSVFLSSDSYALGAAVLLGLNVLALACHELGHALATKHAGRRVPTAGFLVYFGIPSVFVDTTDVWMSGRRARLLTTAAGPSAGLVLAGASAIVGLVVPEAAPWCFKLSFAWYINAMFNLNPFLALDGYYLVMDWLEVPNLRARGLSWVVARLRRRPPAWSTLDREGPPGRPLRAAGHRLAGHRAQHRLPRVRRPRRWSDHRPVARRLDRPRAARHRHRRPAVTGRVHTDRLVWPSLAAAVATDR